MISSFKGSSLKSEIYRALAGTMGIRVLQAALGFIISIALARLLGTASLGLYGATLAAITLVVIPAQAGVARLAGREAAQLSATNQEEQTRSLRSWGLLSIFALSLLTAVAIVLLMASGIMPATKSFIAGIPLIPILGLASLHASMLRGRRKIIVAQSFDVIRNIAFLAVLIGISFCTAEIAPEVAVGLFSCAALLSVAYLAYFLNKEISVIPTGQTEKTWIKWREWSRASVPYALIGGVVTVNSKIDILAIGLFFSKSEAGLYMTANQFSQLTLFALTAATLVASPYFTRLYAQGDVKRLQTLATKIAQVSFGFSLCALIGLFFFGRPILEGLYGDSFGAATPALMALVLAQVIQSSTGSAGPLLTAAGFEKKTLRAAIIALIVKAVTIIPLVALLGSLGAGISTCLSMICLNCILYFSCKRHVKIKTFIC